MTAKPATTSKSPKPRKTTPKTGPVMASEAHAAATAKAVERETGR